MNIIKITNFQVNTTLLLMISIYCVIMQIAIAKSDNSISTVDQIHFSKGIFQEVAVGKEENVIFSPFSIQFALASVLDGAEGQTALELHNVIQILFNGKREVIANDYEKFLDRLSHSSNDDNAVEFHWVNRIYVDKSAKLKRSFIESVGLQSRAEQVDFADSANTVKKINAFVEEQTNHKIKDVLSEGSVDGLTKVVLISAVYFKGNWEKPFSAAFTFKADFFYGSNKVQVDTMHMENNVLYAEFPDLNAKALQLRYANSTISMLILLPNAVDGLNDLEKKLGGRNLKDVAYNLKVQNVAVSLPKFRIEYNLDLIEPLKALGLNAVFDYRKANLSGLLENPDGVYVTAAKQKAYIDVNEAGSEEAAGTYIGLGVLSAPPPRKVFNANHPFMFAIRDSRAVYVMGHLLKF